MAEKKTVKKTVKKVSVAKAVEPKTEVKAEKKLKTPIVKDGKFAVIETGGKQYGVSAGDTVKIEKILNLVKEHKIGDEVSFDKVMLLDDGTKTEVGAPYLSGIKVLGTISEIDRNQKVTVIKFKQKSRYFKKNGHRQSYFKVVINSIV